MQETFAELEVRAADRQLLAAGEPLMERAAFSLAVSVLRNLQRAGFRRSGSTVLALVGKGNNGGDALYASAYLARRGLQVTAVVVPAAHQSGLRAAENAGVRIVASPTEVELRRLARSCGIWIDGMLGIGARGTIRQPFADWIRILSAEREAWPASLQIFAVDLPSGVDVNTGQLFGDVLPADVTVTMGCLKPGLLLPPANRYCGQIEIADLGYGRVLQQEIPFSAAQLNPNQSAAPEKNTASVKSAAAFAKIPKVYRLDRTDLVDTIFPPLPQDHKYSRGVLSLNTGSAEYPGAGVLSVGAALRTGLGMLRYLGGAKENVHLAYPEAVALEGNSDAWLIGSGVTNLASARKSYQHAMQQHAIVVLDAGAIELLADGQALTPTIITPHAGELAKLMRHWLEDADLDASEINRHPAYYALAAAQKTGAVTVLKGSVTLIATPENQLFAQGPATAWLATAGSGDVLAGIIAALAASWQAAVIRGTDGSECMQQNHLQQSHFSLAKIAASGVLLHSLAGAAAAFPSGKTGEIGVGQPITANDMIDAIADVIRDVLKA